MGEIYKVNINVLKDFYNDFNSEKDNFSHSTYNNFLSSYLKTCSDNSVMTMARKLDNMYAQIDKGYTNISN